MNLFRIRDISDQLSAEDRAELESKISELWQLYTEDRQIRQGASFRSIAHRLGISPARVHQIEKTALRKLRKNHPELNPNK